MTAQRSLFDDDEDEHTPYQPHSWTSFNAAREIAGKAGTLRRQVYEHIATVGGCTDEEGMSALRMEGNTYRPRRRELQQRQLVAPSGEQRKTRAGLLAEVWAITGNSVAGSDGTARSEDR